MKIYRPNKRNKILITSFFLLGIFVCALLIVIACHALLYEGLTKRSGFLTVFTLLMTIGTCFGLKITRKLLYVSYSFEGSMLVIHRGRKIVSLKPEDIQDFNTEDNKINFRDPDGRQYTIPRDFEDYNELQNKILNLTAKKSS